MLTVMQRLLARRAVAAVQIGLFFWAAVSGQTAGRQVLHGRAPDVAAGLQPLGSLPDAARPYAPAPSTADIRPAAKQIAGQTGRHHVRPHQARRPPASVPPTMLPAPVPAANSTGERQPRTCTPGWGFARPSPTPATPAAPRPENTSARRPPGCGSGPGSAAGWSGSARDEQLALGPAQLDVIHRHFRKQRDLHVAAVLVSGLGGIGRGLDGPARAAENVQFPACVEPACQRLVLIADMPAGTGRPRPPG